MTTRSVRLLVVFLLSCSWIMIGAAADARNPRTLSKSYTGFGGFVVNGTSVTTRVLDQPPSVVFPARRGERSVSVQVSDKAGASVRGTVGIDIDGDQDPDGYVDFCGKTTRPVPIPNRAIVIVDVYMGTCMNGEPSVVTTGSVTAKFYSTR